MGNTMVNTLVFVYNANSGKLNALIDSAHKVLSPATYDCPLCDITYGVFTENRLWKQFREQSDTAMRFLHKDEFAKQYASKFGHKFTFPIILADTGHALEVVMDTQELKTVATAEELIALLQGRGV